jgi:hypothetical protein
MVVTAKPAFVMIDLYSNVHRCRTIGRIQHNNQGYVCLGSACCDQNDGMYGHPPIATRAERKWTTPEKFDNCDWNDRLTFDENQKYPVMMMANNKMKAHLPMPLDLPIFMKKRSGSS